MAVKHSTVVTIPDDGTSAVGTGEWNANHTIDNDTITYGLIQNVSATDRLLGRDTAGAGDIEELTVGGGVEFTGSAGIQTSAFTGDATKTAGGTALTIANDAVTYAKMQNVSAASKLVGRGDSGAGDPQEITLGANLTMTGTTLAAAGGSGSPGGASLTIQYNNATAFAGMSGTSWDDTNRSLTVTGATVTTSKPVLDLSQTWNAGGVAFTGIKMNVANTASAAASNLIDLQFGGTSEFQVRKTGEILVGDGTNVKMLTWGGDGNRGIRAGNGGVQLYDSSGVLALTALNGSVVIPEAAYYNWAVGSYQELRLYKELTTGTDVALALRNTTLPQGIRAYNTYTDASNYERGAFDWTTTANVLTIGTQAAGTGTARDTQLISAATGVTKLAKTAGSLDGWMQWGGQARVTSDFTVTSSTTLVNVTGLSVSVQAGRTYHFETELYVTDAAAGGVQAAIAGTATATAIQYVGYTIADNAIKAKTNATTLATAVGSTVTTETAGIVVRITGTITVNAAGTLTVQMAQNTSNGTATTAKRGSYFLVHDMP